ncbi:MAG TPA: hypothetical protein VFZ78_13545, partial [Flavisolibacter sp.]
MRRAGRAAWRDRVRNLVTVTCILLASVASAQTTDLEVEQAALDHALVSKDTAMLGRLLHP